MKPLIGQPTPAGSETPPESPIEPMPLEELDRDLENIASSLGVDLAEELGVELGGDGGVIEPEDCVFACACMAAEKDASLTLPEIVAQLSMAPVEDLRLALVLVLLSDVARQGHRKGKPFGGERLLSVIERDPTLAELSVGARRFVELEAKAESAEAQPALGDEAAEGSAVEGSQGRGVEGGVEEGPEEGAEEGAESASSGVKDSAQVVSTEHDGSDGGVS